jgi:hypothetical protein
LVDGHKDGSLRADLTANTTLKARVDPLAAGNGVLHATAICFA